MQQLTRRDFLKTSSAAALAVAAAPLAPPPALAQQGGFTLPKLPYGFADLMPSIDAKTMEIHHDRHHQAYVDGLNKALAGEPKLLAMNIDVLMRQIDKVPEKIRQAVINTGGGHANHSLFWQVMAPKGKGGGGEPGGALAKAINAKKEWGGFGNFQAAFTTAAMTRFGSGWAWLIVQKGELAITSTANQDTPLMTGATPILGLDVWEHAYYLNYQNRRADYVKAWWDVVNWPYVAELYKKA